MEKNAEYYKQLAEIYMAELETNMEEIHQVTIIKGILIELESDLVFFHAKNGGKRTKKSAHQEERLEMLKKSVSFFESIASKNHQLKLALLKRGNHARDLAMKLADTEKELETLKQSIFLHESE